MNKRNVSLAVVMALGLGAAAAAQAADTGFLVRGRATYLDFDNGQNSLPVEVKAGSKWIPEVDISYFYTPNFAMELVLTYPQTVDIDVGGNDAGSVKALPPTLLAQYHFTQMGTFTPYVGAGLNLTLFGKRNVLAGAAHVDKSSVGFALQAGADFALNEKWSLNVDLKYIDMDTGVTVTGNKIGTLDLTPWVASVGLGYKF